MERQGMERRGVEWNGRAWNVGELNVRERKANKTKEPNIVVFKRAEKVKGQKRERAGVFNANKVYLLLEKKQR